MNSASCVLYANRSKVTQAFPSNVTIDLNVSPNRVYKAHADSVPPRWSTNELARNLEVYFPAVLVIARTARIAPPTKAVKTGRQR